MAEPVRYLTIAGKAQFVDRDGGVHQVPVDDTSLQMAWSQGWRPTGMDVLNPGREGRELQAGQVAQQRQDMMGLIAAGIIKAPPPSAPQVIAPTPQPRPVEGFGTDETQLPAWLVEKPRSVGPTEAPAQPLVPEGLISERIPEMAVPTPPVAPLDPQERRQAVLETMGAQKAEPWIPGLPVGAALTGAARTASLGLTDVLSSDMDKAAARAMRKYSPISTAVGEIGGIFTPGGLPSLIGKGVKAAFTATKVAPKVAQIATETAKQAEALEGVLISRGINGPRAINLSSDIAQLSFGSQVAAASKMPLLWKMGQATAVGAGLGAQQQISPMALEEKPWSGIDILKSAGMGAIINNGFTLIGSALGAVRPTVQGWALKKAGISDATKQFVLQEEAVATKNLSTLMGDMETRGYAPIVVEISEANSHFFSKAIGLPELELQLKAAVAGIGKTDAIYLAKNLGAKPADLAFMSNNATQLQLETAVGKLLTVSAADIQKARLAVNNMQSAYANAFPSIDKLFGLPPAAAGLGKLILGGAMGVGAGMVTHDPVTGIIVGLAPLALKKAIGSPFVKDGMMQKTLTEGWAFLGAPAALAATSIYEKLNASELHRELLKQQMDQERLKTNLMAGGWPEQAATNFSTYQTARTQGMINALEKLVNGSAVEKARAGAMVNALNDPRTALARLQLGKPTPEDIEVVKNSVNPTNPEVWSKMENDAKALLEKAKKEVVPQEAQRIARMVLGQGSATTIARRAAFQQTAPSMGSGPPAYQKAIKQTRLDIGKIVGDLTPAQRLMRGIGK